MAYVPRPVVGGDLASLARYVEEELRRVSAEFVQVEGVMLPERHVEPEKPRNGMIAFADGTNWNPGSGRGMYRFDGNTTAWVLLG